MAKSAFRTIKLGTVGELQGGAVGPEFDDKIAAIAADLLRRPMDNRPRKLVLQLEFKPEPTEGNQPPLMTCQAQIKLSLPTARTARTAVNVTQQGEMKFSTVSIDDPHQDGLPFDADETKERKGQ